MRPVIHTIAAIAFAFVAMPALAQPAAMDATAKAPVTSPAPVPSVPPASAQTDGPAAPAEIMAPGGHPGAGAVDAGPSNATPFSGAPPVLPGGTGRQSPDSTGSVGPAVPLSR